MQASDTKVRPSPEGLEHQIQSLRRSTTWLSVLTVLLLVGLVVVGGLWWFQGDEVFAPNLEADVIEEIDAMLEDFSAAWTEGDGAAVVAMMAPDGVHLSGGSGGPISGPELAAFVERLEQFTYEPVGPTLIERQNLDYLVTRSVKIYPDYQDGEGVQPQVGLFRIGPQVGMDGLFIEWHSTQSVLEVGS